MLINDKEDAELNDTEKINDDEAFKKKLLDWLRNNNLKLTTSSSAGIVNEDSETIGDENVMILYEKGKNSLPWKSYVGTLEGWALPQKEHK